MTCGARRALLRLADSTHYSRGWGHVVKVATSKVAFSCSFTVVMRVKRGLNFIGNRRSGPFKIQFFPAARPTMVGAQRVFCEVRILYLQHFS